MINITYKELIRLKNGEPPWSINENWDCAMVIEQLANDLYFSLKPTYEELEKMVYVAIPKKEDNLCEHGFEDWDECPVCRH